MRDITLEDTFRHDFTTRAFATGIPTVLAGTPVLSVLEENNATPITAGVSVSVDRASVVGLNEATVVATAANGYELGKNYSIYISTGTVGGVSVIGEVIGQFTIGSSAAAVDLANGTDGLTALKTGIDAIPTTAMRGTDNALLAASINLTGGAVDTVTDVTNDVGITAAAVDDIWDEIISAAAHNIGQSAAKILRQSGDLVQMDGAVSDVSPAVGGFDTNLTEVDGYWEDAVLIFSNGAANAGLGKPVSTFLNANGAMTFLAPDDWPVTPVNGDDFVLFATHVHPVAQIADAVWDEDLTGHTTADSAGKAVSDIEDDTGELQTDWANGGRLDLILDDGSLKIQLTEGYAADGVAPTAEELLFLVQQSIHEFAITSTTRTVKKLDGSTTAATFTLDDDTSPTSTTRAT